MSFGLEWYTEKGRTLFSTNNYFFRVHPSKVTLPASSASPTGVIIMPTTFPENLPVNRVFLITPKVSYSSDVRYGADSGAIVQSITGRSLTLQRERGESYGRATYYGWTGYVGWLE